MQAKGSLTGAPDPTSFGPSAGVDCVIGEALPKVWDTFVPVYLPDLFPKAKGPIPPVVDVRDQTGRWDEIGRTRTVVLGDGNTAREEITYSDPSDGQAAENLAEFAYTVSGFTGPFSWLVKSAHARWVFTAQSGETQVLWTYGFRSTNILTRPFVALLAATFWRAYMRDGLDHFKALAERG